MEPVLEVRGLSVAFTQYARGLRQTELNVIRDLSVSVHAGEIVAVVGASGSGKSLLAHAVLGLLPYNAKMDGEILYKGGLLTEKRLRNLRGREVSLIPQSVSFLDPLMKAGPQLWNGRRGADIRGRTRAALARYGLDAGTEGLYPFELSGGMARRVLIASAAMENPALIIADEPTPGLDAAAAKRVLGHFRELADAGAGILLITHDLETALSAAARVVVFYAGMAVEEAAAGDFLAGTGLRHPYTKALWQAMPCNGFSADSAVQPYAGELRGGCPYAPRCAQYAQGCGDMVPYKELRGGRVRCLYAR